MKKWLLLLAASGLLAACNQNPSQGGTEGDTGTSSGSDSSGSSRSYQRSDTNSGSAVPQSGTKAQEPGSPQTDQQHGVSGNDNGGTSANPATR